MGRLARLLGGQPDNAAWLPGAGDLFVTVFAGRSRRLGLLLGRGLSYDEAKRELAGLTLESAEIITRTARALPKLEKRGILKTSNFPLLMHLNGLINRGETVNIPWDAFS
jgi:glycerol-3-phosphate dehydrogenase (NAD(P)+)